MEIIKRGIGQQTWENTLSKVYIICSVLRIEFISKRVWVQWALIDEFSYPGPTETYNPIRFSAHGAIGWKLFHIDIRNRKFHFEFEYIPDWLLKRYEEREPDSSTPTQIRTII